MNEILELLREWKGFFQLNPAALPCGAFLALSLVGLFIRRLHKTGYTQQTQLEDAELMRETHAAFHPTAEERAGCRRWALLWSVLIVLWVVLMLWIFVQV